MSSVFRWWDEPRNEKGIPAMLEATIEATYPTPEASTMGFLFLGNE